MKKFDLNIEKEQGIGGLVVSSNLLALVYLRQIMARPLRVDFDGAICHLTSRGNVREEIFDEDGDREPTDCPGGASLRI